MKKIMLTLAAVLCCAMTTTVLTACGGSDDSGNVPGPDKTPVAGVMEAKFEVSEDIIKYLDVTVEYYDADGSVKKEQMDKTTWSKQVKAKLTAKLGARLSMKVKDGVDVSTITKMTFAVADPYKLYCVDSSSSEVGAVKIGGASSSITITGNQLAELLKKRENGVFSKFLYILDGKTITSTDWE